MTHRRKDIRDLVVGYLTGLTTTGARVTASRLYAHNSLPSLNIITKDEVMTSDLRNRELELVVEIRARATFGLLDQLDLIASEVEAALETNYLLDGDCVQMFYVATGDTELDAEGDQPIGMMPMTYQINYQFDPLA